MTENIQRIKEHLKEASLILEAFMSSDVQLEAIQMAGQLMVESLSSGKKIISCGNGGSHCDAMHFAEELTGRYRDDRPALAAIAISDPSHISCVGNDYGYEFVFSRFLEGIGTEGDVLLCISTSGNSPNVVSAAKTAKSKGIKVVALTGKDGGALSPLADVEIRAPFSTYADRAQEIHIKVIHILIDFIEQNISA